MSLMEFSTTHRVQFSETDMAGVVHFSNFFRWMEEVEHAFFRSLGLSVAMTHDGVDIGWPRVSVSCDYFAPARFEDEIRLNLRVVKVGKKSLNYEVDFFRGEQRIAHGKATSVCCMISAGGMAATTIPDALLHRLAPGPESRSAATRSPT
jgi:YbgC/YbaW family acyl-CoA thioester hydrolase